MADQTPTELAELTLSVLAALPHEVLSPIPGDSGRTEPVMLEQLEGELYLARWGSEPPDLGDEREYRLSGDHAVYLLTATVAGYGPEDDLRLLRVTGLRRRRQRRSSPRAQVRDLVLISHNGDVDAELVDVSADGVAFVIDRPLAVDTVIRAVLNVQGGVIPTVARVRQVSSLECGYRVGCVFTEISDANRARLGRHAATNPNDRRTGSERAETLRGRLFLSE